jgi:hypothetical protein
MSFSVRTLVLVWLTVLLGFLDSENALFESSECTETLVINIVVARAILNVNVLI